MSSSDSAAEGMFVQALLAFLVLPGVVAYAVPILWLVATSHRRLEQPLGLVPLVAGCVGLLWCIRDFYVRGKGTLAPWSPPKNLVVVGLYRYSRNPMYVSVLLVLLGWAATFDLAGLYTYAAVVAVCFHLRVLINEEPFLARTHADAWDDYVRRVPRWLW